ncbi:MAG: hypothetical protein ABFD89_23740 [Bryobacteraceae bacterium]
MSEHKHSRGPWARKSGTQCTIVDAAGHVVCHLKKRGRKETTEANASLIETAPRMYDALESIVNAFDWTAGARELLACDERTSVDEAIAIIEDIKQKVRIIEGP